VINGTEYEKPHFNTFLTIHIFFYHSCVKRQYSVTQALTVNNRKIPAGITRYETSVNGQPVYGGANDPRMGDLHSTSDPGSYSN
jgi:hypothetical protein